MRRRTDLPPLEPRHAAPPPVRILADSAQIVADVREHFPEFEAQLVREYPDCPLDAFANQDPRAILLVLIRMAEQELRRRNLFVATLLRAGPAKPADDIDRLERFAIQEEGTHPSGQTQEEARGGTGAT